MVLPAPDTDEKNGLNLLRRLYGSSKFDKEEEMRKLAERSEHRQKAAWPCFVLFLLVE